MEDILSFQQGPLIADIAVNVFSYLSLLEKQKVAQVCRYWREIVYLSCLWKDLTVILPLNPSSSLFESLKRRKITRVMCTRATEEELECLFDKNPGLTHFHLRGCPQVSEGFLQRKIPTLENLEYLFFRECKQVTDKLTKDHLFVSSLKNLKSLSLKHCHKIYFAGFRRLTEHLENLEYLDLTNCANLGNHCLRILPNSCPKLTRLLLGDCDWVSFKGLRHVCLLQNLKELNLRSCRGIDDGVIHFVSIHLPNLESLDIREVPYVANETIQAVAETFPNLKYFAFGGSDLDFFDNTSDLEDTFEGIAKMKDLECLKIDVESFLGGITDSCFFKFGEEFQNLKKLDLGSLEQFSVDAARVMAEKMPYIESLTVTTYGENINVEGLLLFCSQLESLKSLEFSMCELTHSNLISLVKDIGQLTSLSLSAKKLTDSSLRGIVKHLHDLTSLCLDDCSRITNAGVRCVAKGMPQLQELYITDCPNITNEAACLIGKHLTNLEVLRIEGKKIDDQGFVHICQNLPKLRNLITNTSRITNQGFIEGAKALGNLELLKITSDHITDEGIKEALVYFKGLTDMVLMACPCLTLDAVEVILRGMPTLTHLRIEFCDQIFEEDVERELSNVGHANVSVFSCMPSILESLFSLF